MERRICSAHVKTGLGQGVQVSGFSTTAEGGQSDRKINLSQLISHRVRRVLRDKSKNLCVLSGLCEIFEMKFHTISQKSTWAL